MATNGDQDYDARKLDALMSISTAIASLGETLSIVVRQSLDQTRSLSMLDKKIDTLIEMVGSK